jgi:malonyl CoA-acyl carrier protein transacylase
MQQASDENSSGMVTVTGLTEEEIEGVLKSVRALCKEDVQIMIANHLYSKGFVLAGERTAIDHLLKIPVSENEISIKHERPTRHLRCHFASHLFQISL